MPHVELVASVLESLARGGGLLHADLAEAGVEPATEPVLLVPLRLSVADHHDLECLPHADRFDTLAGQLKLSRHGKLDFYSLLKTRKVWKLVYYVGRRVFGSIVTISKCLYVFVLLPRSELTSSVPGLQCSFQPRVAKETEGGRRKEQEV